MIQWDMDLHIYKARLYWEMYPRFRSPSDTIMLLTVRCSEQQLSSSSPRLFIFCRAQLFVIIEKEYIIYRKVLP